MIIKTSIRQAASEYKILTWEEIRRKNGIYKTVSFPKDRIIVLSSDCVILMRPENVFVSLLGAEFSWIKFSYVETEETLEIRIT